jgi:hypothetical protein
MVCCPQTPKNIISEKRPAFEIGKNSGTATNDKFNKVRYLNNFPIEEIVSYPKKLHRRVVTIDIDHAMYSNWTYLQN